MQKMQVTVHTAASILLIGLIYQVDCCDPPSHRVNGCSIPLGLPYYYKNTFKPACNKHDVCYACGKSKGVSKKECDEAFVRDIRNICTSDSSVKFEGFCSSVTDIYKIGVASFGFISYENPSLSWCSEEWVSYCF